MALQFDFDYMYEDLLNVYNYEQNEITGSLTLKTMNRVADKLDCVFVYGFVPRTSLDDTVRKQASIISQKRMTFF